MIEDDGVLLSKGRMPNLKTIFFMQHTWILASSSPERKRLLSEIIPEFRCISPDVDEVREPGNNPPVWVPQTNARLKASFVAEQYPDAWVIGADTVVIFGTVVFNKPKDLADAKRTLQLLSGKTHSAVTGLEIVCKTANFRYVTTVETKVTFNPIDDTFISRYLEEVKPLKSAGSYTIRHPLTQTFVHLEGSQTNVSGFPTEAFRKILKTLPQK